MSRKNAEFFNSKIAGKNKNNIYLVNFKHEFANQIRLSNVTDLKEVKNQIQSILNSDTDTSEKLIKVQKLILEEQNAIQEILRMGFVGLAYQNAQLFQSNEKLSEKLTNLQITCTTIRGYNRCIIRSFLGEVYI